MRAAADPRCIVCILIMVVMLRGIHGAHGRIDKPSPHEPRCGGSLDVQRMASEPLTSLNQRSTEGSIGLTEVGRAVLYVSSLIDARIAAPESCVQKIGGSRTVILKCLPER